MSNNLLPVHHMREIAHISSHDGPVWPLKNNEDEKDLNALMSVFDCKLAVINNVISRSLTKNKTKTSLVVAFSDDLANLASLYGHLTNRNWTVLHCNGKLRDIKPSILIIKYKDLTYEVMEEIHKANSSQSLGIITGFSY